MSSAIAGKSVLVTRPAGQAQGLIDQLAGLGATAIALPVIEIQSTTITPAERQKIIDLDRYELVIFISTNAVQLGLSVIDDYWPQLPAHTAWLAVGEATKRALESAGVQAIVPVSGANSEALLQMPELQSVNGKRLLIIKGEDGRELLAETLADRGAKLDELCLYRRERIQYNNQAISEKVGSSLPDALVVTSVDILKAAHEALSPCYPNLISVNLVAASERIARQAKSLGYHSVLTASGASNQAIIDALTNGLND